MKFTTEPSAWVEAIRVILLCGVLFGLNLSDAQIAGVIAALAVIGGLIVRQSTTTNQALVEVGLSQTVKKAIDSNKKMTDSTIGTPDPPEKTVVIKE